MERTRLAVAVFVLALGSSLARADFRVTGFGYPGPVDDVYEFYALSNGTNGSGTRLASANVNLENVDIGGTGQFGHGFVFKFVDNTGGAPADTTGTALYHASGNNPSVLFHGRSDRTFINILGDESTADPTLYVRTSTTPDPDFHSNYNVPVFGFAQDGSVPGGIDATPASNSGRGALIAVAVVQHGDPVAAGCVLRGLSGAENTFTAISPEPGSAAMLSLALGTLVARRRRSGRGTP